MQRKTLSISDRLAFMYFCFSEKTKYRVKSYFATVSHLNFSRVDLQLTRTSIAVEKSSRLAMSFSIDKINNGIKPLLRVNKSFINFNLLKVRSPLAAETSIVRNNLGIIRTLLKQSIM